MVGASAKQKRARWCRLASVRIRLCLRVRPWPGARLGLRRTRRSVSSKAKGIHAAIWPSFGHGTDGRAACRLLEAPASARRLLVMDTLTYWNGTWHEGNPAILGPRDH